MRKSPMVNKQLKHFQDQKVFYAKIFGVVYMDMTVLFSLSLKPNILHNVYLLE